MAARKARSSAAPGCDPCPGLPNSPVFPRLLVPTAGGGRPLLVGPLAHHGENKWTLTINDQAVRCGTGALTHGPGSRAFQRLVAKAGIPGWKPAGPYRATRGRPWCRAFGEVLGKHVERWTEYCRLVEARRRKGGAS